MWMSMCEDHIDLHILTVSKWAPLLAYLSHLILMACMSGNPAGEFIPGFV